MTQNDISQTPWIKSYPVDIQWDMDIPEKTMVQLFEESVKKHKNQTCINFMDKKLTYQEVSDMVDSFAAGLQKQGIGKGSTVGVCLPNTPFYVIAYYGAMKAGATVANFNPTSPPEALAQQVNDSKTDLMVAINLQGSAKQPLYPNIEKVLGMTQLKKVVVCDMADALPTGKGIGFRAINKLCDLMEVNPFKFIHKKALELRDGMAVIDEIKKPSIWKRTALSIINKFCDLTGDPLKFLHKKALAIRDKNGVQEVAKVPKDDKHLSFKKLIKTKGKMKPVEIKPDDVALLQYTGGTTGVPKGASLTHKNLASNTQQTKLWFNGVNENKTQQKTLAVLPFFHVFSMTVQMNLALHMGDELIIMAKPDLVPMLKIIDREKPDKFAAVPALYKKITDCKDIGSYDLSSLKYCLSGGAPLPETTIDAFKKLTGVELVEGYGLSETSPLVIANPVNGNKKLGSIGLPLPKTEVKFASIDFPDESVPLHMEGEICLRGPQVMKKYFGNPDETAKVFDKDGFFHTGDIGRMDKDGYVFITDRKKDMIIVNGFKAFPKKIEEAIRKFEDVSEVIVIGIPNDQTGESVKAFVQPKEGKTVDAKALVEFLKDKLTTYELPRVENIESRDSLPLTQIGKPDKKPLKEEERVKAEAAKKKPAVPKGP